MRKALVVGIDQYPHMGTLHGCVNDAQSVNAIIERHGTGGPNFDVKLLTASSTTPPVERAQLKADISSLFADDSEVALFYFAGHGHRDDTGAFLLTSDSRSGDEGVSLANVIKLANLSPAKNRIVVLDSCHSGAAGGAQIDERVAELREGLTILTASTAEQYASEENGSGVFTSLFVDALHGAAANLLGHITPGSVYAHIDQSLGSWDQRPVFKTNVKRFVSLREVAPPISQEDLRRIPEFFPSATAIFPLDPSYEPERSPADVGVIAPHPLHTSMFSVLQKYNRVNLVVPINAPHMWHAAMQSKACKLTILGQHYHRLVTSNRI
jgi:hypothetical protein